MITFRKTCLISLFGLSLFNQHPITAQNKDHCYNYEALYSSSPLVKFHNNSAYFNFEYLSDDSIVLNTNHTKTIVYSEHSVYDTKVEFNENTINVTHLNKTTNDSFSKNSIDNTSYFAYEFFPLRNCFVRYVVIDKKPNIEVFNYYNGEYSYYTFYPGMPVGYNDTCILISSKKFKYNGVKFKEDEIIALNENGIFKFCTKEQIKQKIAFSIRKFFSGDYSVFRKTVRYINNDCSSYSLVRDYIDYKGEIIDSIDYFSFDANKISYRFMNDTFYYYQNSFLKREYKSGLKVSSINYLNDLRLPLELKDLNHFKNSILIIKNERIILLTNLNSRNSSLLNSVNNKTINEVPLSDETISYTIVALFDLKTFDFIGYPKVNIN